MPGLNGRISDDYRSSTMEVLRVAFLPSLVLEFFATLSIAMVAVFIGFRLYYDQMAFLPGFFVLLLAPEFYPPLRAMGTQYHARMAAIGASERIVALLETKLPPERTSAAGAAACRSRAGSGGGAYPDRPRMQCPRGEPPRPGDKWHPDEVFIRIKRVQH